MGMANSKSRQHRVASWSDLNHDVLLLIMIKVGFLDFLSFRRVCKSWRSLALSNQNKFLASRPPMSIWISRRNFRKDCCYLEDSDGRKFKTTLRHSAQRTLAGVTCGYLILYGLFTRDFWLVNPITRHELHFPAFRFYFNDTPGKVRATVVYSHSLSGWVFVMGHKNNNLIWFSVAGKGDWTSVNCGYPTLDLHVFKGKIYSINSFCEVYELRLNQYPRLTLLKTNNVPNVRDFGWEIVSCLCERLYVIRSNMLNVYTILGLDTCVQPKITIGYGSYAINQYSDHLQLYGIDTYFHASCQKDNFFKMRYYTHDCMSVHITD